MRIHCEGEKLLIPIHGFPVINNTKAQLFPKLIDLGKRAVGDVATKTISIDCNVPVNFEYEITMLQPHADIRVEPMFGDIAGMGKTDVYITYAPTNFTTAQAEIQFRTTEFESEPIFCRITGSAIPTVFKMNETGENSIYRNRTRDDEEETTMSVRKNKHKTTFSSKPPVEIRPQSKGAVRLDKIEEKVSEASFEITSVVSYEDAEKHDVIAA